MYCVIWKYDLRTKYPNTKYPTVKYPADKITGRQKFKDKIFFSKYASVCFQSPSIFLEWLRMTYKKNFWEKDHNFLNNGKFTWLRTFFHNFFIFNLRRLLFTEKMFPLKRKIWHYSYLEHIHLILLYIFHFRYLENILFANILFNLTVGYFDRGYFVVYLLLQFILSGRYCVSCLILRIK